MIYKKNNPYKILIYIIALFFAILNVLTIKIAGFSKVLPMFDLMSVFYFAIFNKIFPLWFIFILGFLNDALNGNPLGLTSLIYIILIQIFYFVNKRFVICENFLQIFYQFIAFLALFLLTKWTFLSIYNNAFYDPTILIVQLILSSSFYVVMHRFFYYLNQKFS